MEYSDHLTFQCTEVTVENKSYEMVAEPMYQCQYAARELFIAITPYIASPAVRQCFSGENSSKSTLLFPEVPSTAIARK